MLGTVTPQGNIEFASDDQNACRRFLRSRGLEVRRRLGWADDRGNHGAIYFDGPGKWRAVYFPAGA